MRRGRSRSGPGASLLLILFGSQAIPAQTLPSGPAEATRAVHLLSRATWGVLPADVEAVLALGPEAWLSAQMSPRTEASAALAARLERFPAASMAVEDLMREYAPPRPGARPNGDSALNRAAMPQGERRAMALRSPQRILADLVGARLTRAVHSERQLEDVMTDFWYNHFNVFFNKGIDRYLVGDYERTAIRPHVFGRFETMLRATAAHPAMLFYLDNAMSAAPDSTAMARRRRERGMNENYARELLELHTLGVDGGYTQDDVIAVARAFTGWTITRNGGSMAGEAMGAPTFIFRPVLHDMREKTVLGVTLPAGRGVEDGHDVLRIVASHPSTARHLAKKLVERFVSDAGDAALEDTLAAVFLRTAGDLGAVTRTLFTSERFYAREHHRTKVKTPFELVASTLRVLHADVGLSPDVMNALRTMGQLPYTASAPTGFPAASADWVNSSAMLARMNFALDLAGGRVRGVRADGPRLRSGASRDDALAGFIANVLPGLDPDPILARVREDLAAQSDAGPRDIARRAVGLVLGSPEFQRR